MPFLERKKAILTRNELNRLAIAGKLNGSMLHLKLTALIRSGNPDFICLNEELAGEIGSRILGFNDQLEIFREQTNLVDLDLACFDQKNNPENS